MKSVQFLADFNAVDGAGNSYTKYIQGSLYPLNDETARQVAAGYAQEVEDPTPNPQSMDNPGVHANLHAPSSEHANLASAPIPGPFAAPFSDQARINPPAASGVATSDPSALNTNSTQASSNQLADVADASEPVTNHLAAGDSLGASALQAS